jgi:predicted RNA-binding protein with PIN domain
MDISSYMFWQQIKPSEKKIKKKQIRIASKKKKLIEYYTEKKLHTLKLVFFH